MSSNIPFYETIYRDVYMETQNVEAFVGIEEKEFNIWMRPKVVDMDKVNSYVDVAPNLDVINDVLGPEYKYPGTRECHKVAKEISLIKPEFEFYSGVVYRENYKFEGQSYYYHSFNVFNKKIYDFSKLDSYNNCIPDEYLPHTYYGVQIPKEFLNKNTQSILLIDYYKESIKVQ